MIKTCTPDWIIADLSVDFPEVPVNLIQRALMRAARKFSAACMYHEWIEIPTQANVQHYPFERYLPEGFGVQYVTDVRYNGCCIECLDDECKRGCPSGYRLDDLKQITLVGYCPGTEDDPECKDILEVRVALRIEPDACELPCDMVERFEDELKDGAQGNILSMNRKPWSDFRQAEFYENRFEGGIASAKCLIANKMQPETGTLEPECLI